MCGLQLLAYVAGLKLLVYADVFMQVGLLGRHAPKTVVAKLEAGWVKITRAAVRGHARLIEVTEDVEESLGRDQEQVLGGGGE